MVGETAATSSLMFCFKSTVVLGFFFVHLALEISPEEEVLRLGTLVLMNIEEVLRLGTLVLMNIEEVL